MILLSKLLLAYSCGLVDRFRGDKINVFISKPVESFIYGLMVAALIGGFTLWQAFLFAILWAVGAAFGWGCPLGAMLNDRSMNPKNYEWWQFWIFRERVVPAMILRGFMWGLCVAPMAYFNPLAGVFAFMIPVVFPLAVAIAKMFPKIVNVDPWARQEFVRGWLVGMLSLLLGIS